MAKFVKDLEGVTIDFVEDSVTETTTIPEDIACLKLRTIPKVKNVPNRELYLMNAKTSWEMKEANRKIRKQRRALNIELEEKIEKRNQQMKKQRLKKKEIRERNEERGLQYQIIKNNKRIQKMSKKAKAVVRKMPKEDFEKYLHAATSKRRN